VEFYNFGVMIHFKAQILRNLKWGLLSLVLLTTSSFSPFDRHQHAVGRQPAPCTGIQTFYGYTFLNPEIVHKNAAFAPFFLKWDDYYDRVFFNRDIQRDENLAEWSERFCGQPELSHVEYVVYKSTTLELSGLRDAAMDHEGKTPLPYTLGGNTFAEMIAENGCTEVVDYLVFAKKCEPYVIPRGSAWQLAEQDPDAMQQLIREGLGRFKSTESHFL
jgi:hypothetical protein